MPDDLLEVVGAGCRESFGGLHFAISAKSERSGASPAPEELWEFGLNVRTHARREVILNVVASLRDRVAPFGARLGGW
jgi:hypothetical protein